jgi:hypothetical protein
MAAFFIYAGNLHGTYLRSQNRLAEIWSLAETTGLDVTRTSDLIAGVLLWTFYSGRRDSELTKGEKCFIVAT